MNKAWWKECVVYQIYPRSFYDTNNDGIGDLQGVIQKLDYIKSLGVDVIWLCPIYKSPNDDNGYDISDYRDIMDEFGSLSDFDELLDRTHSLGLKIILDLVVNHSSDEHQWFQESRKSKNNPYRDYYYWRKGVNGNPPNNWISFFHGSAWEYDECSDEYFLHLFSKKQPDLNWENPKLRTEVYQLMKFWLDKGIDGFRMDVIPLISKNTGFPSTDYKNFNDVIENVYANGPRVHEFLQEMHSEVTGNYNVMTVGEGPGITPSIANLYVGEKRNELNMIFHFDHLFLGNGDNGKYDVVPWTLPTFKRIFETWDNAVGEDGWNSIFLGNHDFSRIVSRFGNDEQFRKPSAKLLSMLLLSMRGTVYLYQGDEMGMTNVAFDSIEDYNDIETVNSYKEAALNGKDLDNFLKVIHDHSRDNARTPVQWDNTPNAGFSTATPWLKVNPNYSIINVMENESDPDSILHFYRNMISIRKSNNTLVYGKLDILNIDDPNLFAYCRQDEAGSYLVILNLSDSNQSFNYVIDKPICLLSNYSGKKVWRNGNLTLKAWEANLFKLK